MKKIKKFVASIISIVVAISAVVGIIWWVSGKSLPDFISGLFPSASQSLEPSMNETLESPTTIVVPSTSEVPSSAPDDEPDFFSNAFENHTPDDAATQVSFGHWDPATDTDIRGEAHPDELGLKLSVSNLFQVFGSNLSTEIVSDIHLTRNSARAGQELLLMVAVSSESSGSPSNAVITVLVDGEEQGKPTKPISGSTTSPTEITIDATNCQDEVVIHTVIQAAGSGLVLGYFLSGK